MPDTSPALPMADLLTELETAVQSGNRPRALDLFRQIEQRLLQETADCADIERQVRALRCALEHPTQVTRLLTLNDLQQQRSGGASDLVYPVWFGTNRQPLGDGFSGQRHPTVTYGRALVHVPEAHRFGETGSSLWQRMRRFDLRDDRLRLQCADPRDQDTFFSELRDEMEAARENGETPHALVFLHGYNTSFEQAAIRAAQLGVDLNVSGATAFFSWPSRGSALAYTIDEASIEASEAAITEFLVKFSRECGADKVHIIAHSMGNRGLLRALQRIAGNAQTSAAVQFGQIFLAAPDVDRDLFLDLSALYSAHAERVTLYASNADKAVHMSAKFHDSPRAGYYSPYTIAANIDTVAVPDFDVDMLGHGYFAQADALLSDIHGLIRNDATPAERQRFIPAQFNGQTFWRFRP